MVHGRGQGVPFQLERGAAVSIKPVSAGPKSKAEENPAVKKSRFIPQHPQDPQDLWQTVPPPCSASGQQEQSPGEARGMLEA